ncbi:F-box/kelch-repeat protein At3g23880-like [Rhododendron vialii]|uniref:F-box/kelch-repeat protein At3g23880-like n=1 Tax=Rhododendron vialii TaxID=182163 RepID=UPI00265E1D13|nr:F-box/kelch-repeat protein At3g23880-like [Rhododendron vialii]
MSRRLHYHYIMGYVKGLFCLWEHDNIFLWNPSIRKSIILPKPGITKKTHDSLADDLGFGYDLRSNDYKVVRIVTRCGSDRSQDDESPLVEVYSLKAGSWKMNRGAGESFPLGFRIAYSQNFTSCLEGVLHWAAKAKGNWNNRLVLSFDLCVEVFKTIKMPNGLESARFDITTSVFGGFLSLLCEDNVDRANKSCSIWIMKEYGVVDSWYKYVKIDLTGGM